MQSLKAKTHFFFSFFSRRLILSDLSFGQRQSIEKQLDKKKGAINKLAKKLLPAIRKADREKMKKAKDAN